jgi:ribose transport system substrate-binding protein
MNDSPMNGADGVRIARRAVAAAEAAPTSFHAPGPAFNAASARGKTVWFVTIPSVPFASLIDFGLKQALKAAGLKLVIYDGQGTVPKYSQGINQGIAQKASVIVEAQIPAQLFSQDIAKAKRAGIPVIVIENEDPGLLPPTAPPGVVAAADQPHRAVGKLMADFTIADSGGTGKVVVLWSSDAKGIGVPQLKGITDEFKKLAPGMTIETRDVPVARWTSDLPTLTGTLIADRNVRYLLPLYDGMVLNMLPAVHAANAQDRVKIVSFNALPAILTSLGKGDVVAADVGASGQQLGWALADQVLRVLTHHRPVLNVQLPIRLFDGTNVGSINLNAPQQTWYGNVDFAAAYQKLWGLKK